MESCKARPASCQGRGRTSAAIGGLALSGEDADVDGQQLQSLFSGFAHAECVVPDLVEVGGAGAHKRLRVRITHIVKNPLDDLDSCIVDAPYDCCDARGNA